MEIGLEAVLNERIRMESKVFPRMNNDNSWLLFCQNILNNVEFKLSTVANVDRWTYLCRTCPPKGHFAGLHSE